MIEATVVSGGSAANWARAACPVLLLACVVAGAQDREGNRAAPRTLSIEREEQERRERELQLLERLLEAERDGQEADERRRAATRARTPAGAAAQAAEATPSKPPERQPSAPKAEAPTPQAASAPVSGGPASAAPAVTQQADSGEPCRLHVSQLSSSGTLTYASVTQMPGARRLPSGSVYTPPVRLADGREVIFEVGPDGCARLARGVR